MENELRLQKHARKEGRKGFGEERTRVTPGNRRGLTFIVEKGSKDNRFIIAPGH